MRKLRAMWMPISVQVMCAWCFSNLEALTASEIKHLGQAAVKCHECGGLNTLPSDLLALVKTASTKIDPDNPPGRARAWDSIAGNIVLKRAMEIALVGHHSMTYVGHPDNGWTYVKEILGEMAVIMQKCPCGNLNSLERECTCTFDQIEKHRASKPFQIALHADIIIEAVTPKAEEFFAFSEPYTEVLARIKRIRYQQSFGRAIIWPEKGTTRSNPAVFDFLNFARTRLGLTSDLLVRVQKVSRTIAEMDGKELVEAHHMAEAVTYRTPLLDYT